MNCHEIEMKFQPITHCKIDDGTERPTSLENKSNHSAFYSKVKKERNFERGNFEEHFRHMTSLSNTALHTEAGFAVSHSALEVVVEALDNKDDLLVEFRMP